jgi:hypothetical protein
MYTQEEIIKILAFNRANVRLNTENAQACSGRLGDMHSFVCSDCGCIFPRKLGAVIKIAEDGSNKPACTKCRPSKFYREEWARFICEQLTGNNFPKVRPQFLKPSPERRPLELDGFCEKLNLAFEYQGEQHYKPFGNITQRDVDAQQERDREKKTLCDDKGIKLIIIKHDIEPSQIELQIRDQLESFCIPRVVAHPDWSKFVMQGRPTSEEKARLHSKLMDYELEVPVKTTNSDSDFVFRCRSNVNHNPIQVKIIKPGIRPACRECSYKVAGEKNRITHTSEQLIAAGQKCNPTMLLQEWAGQNKSQEWLYKCSNTKCGYVWPYSAKTILNGGEIETNVCFSCKPKSKPRVQFWQVAKVAFELGGKCEPAIQITKRTTLTLHCHNVDHKSFKLTVAQLLDSNMWCDLPPCNKRNRKIGQLKSSQVRGTIEKHFEGLKFLAPPPDGQGGTLELACRKCEHPITNKTYKVLRTARSVLTCKICKEELGKGWEKGGGGRAI